MPFAPEVDAVVAGQPPSQGGADVAAAVREAVAVALNVVDDLKPQRPAAAEACSALEGAEQEPDAL